MKKRFLSLFFALGLGLILSSCGKAKSTDTVPLDNIKEDTSSSIEFVEVNNNEEEQEEDKKEDKIETFEVVELPIDEENVIVVSEGVNVADILADNNNKEVKTTGKISAMTYVDNKIQELLDSDDFKEAPLSEKEEMATVLLNNLADEGYIEKDSISPSDDIVSFTYSDEGILGGIKLEDFDPELN